MAIPIQKQRIPVPILVRPLIGFVIGLLGLIIIAIASVVVILGIIMAAFVCLTLPITAIFMDEIQIDGNKATFTRGKK